MRVLMVNKYAYVTAGADKQCFLLTKLLREAGHEVALLSTVSERNVETDGAFVPGLVTHETRDELPARQRLQVFRNAMWNSDAVRAMKSIVHEFRPDLVHAHKLYPHLSTSLIVSARRMRLPVVQTLYDYEFMSANPLDATGGRIDRSESRSTYRLLNTATFAARRWLHAPAVSEWITVSDFVARTYAERGIDATVIYNLADADLERRPLPASDRDGIAFVGTLSAEKGVMDVLEVARQLAGERFVLAGRGPLKDVVARRAAELPNVEFRGHLDSGGVREALSSARVALIPSRWSEPGPLVALEAMAVGTPIAAYGTGGLVEYVSGTDAGLVVDPDPKLLAAACRSLLANEKKWATCSASGLRAIANDFSNEVHLRSVLDVYERAMSRCDRSI